MGRSSSNGPSRRQSLGGAENISKLPSNGYMSRRRSSQIVTAGSNSATAPLTQATTSLGLFDSGRAVDRNKTNPNATDHDNKPASAGEHIRSNGILNCIFEENGNSAANGKPTREHEDYVSGMLYDMLQKEVIALRKACHEKDQSLKDKDDAVEVGYCLI